jgi:EAL domain-containing protein (putative c-di-GMP-specific phosphodiesterase class I)
VPEITDRVAEFEDLIKYYRTSAKVSDAIIVADRDAIEKSRRRELIDYAIQNAITNNLFEVYYQPIYSLKEKKFNSCEALIRLRDPALGFISPDEFIPIAEQNGRIVEIGRFVIEAVCRFIKECNPEQYGLDCIDVNLSVIQCMHPEIISDIEDTLKKYNVPRSMISLEVTETASAKSYALLQSRLNELHSNGFTISLDDFGTGFSSVEYLINFPFDVVKLDKSLVWAYMSTKKYEPILQHYMPMLHGLGTKIVAEGVETRDMVKALDELGCDYLQGYYYSRPVPKETFLEFIKNNQEVKIA